MHALRARPSHVTGLGGSEETCAVLLDEFVTHFFGAAMDGPDGLFMPVISLAVQMGVVHRDRDAFLDAAQTLWENTVVVMHLRETAVSSERMMCTLTAGEDGWVRGPFVPG